MYDFFFFLFLSQWGINNEIPKRTNESMRMKDASRIMDEYPKKKTPGEIPERISHRCKKKKKT